jgi:hypothetical protein
MSTLKAIRRWIFAVLVLGVTGTGLELFLIEHYEDTLQLVPLVSIAMALAVLVWHGIRGDALSTRMLQAAMVLFVVSGTVGMGLHFRGGAEFQLEIDPEQNRWDIFSKVIRAKAPPVLASGVLVQLGLLGLVYAYRHPSLDRRKISVETKEMR